MKIPAPAATAKRGRRSETGARGRKSALKGVGRGGRGKSRPLAETREYREATAERRIPRGILPRKAAKLEVAGARTVNRHRWSRRVSTGAREIHGQGTRQNDPVTSGERVPGDRPQRNGPGDCLTKTQGCAKPQGEVYGLTPARCRKVKRRGHREGSPELKPR